MNNSLFDLLEDSFEITDIDWRLENSKKESIIFYRLGESDKAFDQFLLRIENAKFQAVVVLGKLKSKIQNNIFSISKETDFLELQKKFLDKFYPYTDRKIIAVTGTNGKTSSVEYLRQLLMLSGKSVLSIGTLGVYLNEDKVDVFGLTTPSFIDFRKFLSNYDSDFVVFEASSHSIEQRRFYKIFLDAALWTSFSQDHLDYHKTMDAYFESKLKIKDNLKQGAYIFVHKSDQQIYVDKLNMKLVQGTTRTELDFLKVSFNNKNLTLCLAALNSLGVPSWDKTEKLKSVPGRFNLYQLKKNTVIIDYAHTPDAISNICLEVKRSYSKRIITVIGCGGDRDKSKRPLMGQAACRHSDFTFITTDNPRFENPSNIIKDIVSGLDSFQNFKVVEKREKAISEALNEENVIILILGKGHEEYMDIKGTKHPYSDLDIIKDYSD